jgi:hypothetical protein
MRPIRLASRTAGCGQDNSLFMIAPGTRRGSNGGRWYKIGLKGDCVRVETATLRFVAGSQCSPHTLGTNVPSSLKLPK